MFQKIRLTKEIYLVAGVIILYCIAVIVNLGYLPLDGEEPRRAVVSIEMLHSGNLIMPTIFGWEYFNKPAVFNWFMTLIMYITGNSSEWSVRIISLLVVVCWAVCHYFFTRKFFPKNIAALSALFLATGLDLFFYSLSHGGEIDIFYGFIVYLQVAFLFYYGHQKKWLQLFIWSYFFCAVGFLTKGFPSLLFQGLTLLAFCVYQRSVLLLFRWQHFLGILVFALLVGCYLY